MSTLTNGIATGADIATLVGGSTYASQSCYTHKFIHDNILSYYGAGLHVKRGVYQDNQLVRYSDIINSHPFNFGIYCGGSGGSKFTKWRIGSGSWIAMSSTIGSTYNSKYLLSDGWYSNESNVYIDYGHSGVIGTTYSETLRTYLYYGPNAEIPTSVGSFSVSVSNVSSDLDGYFKFSNVSYASPVLNTNIMNFGFNYSLKIISNSVNSSLSTNYDLRITNYSQYVHYNNTCMYTIHIHFRAD